MKNCARSILLLVLSLVAGCGTGAGTRGTVSPAPTANGAELKVQDDSGRTIALPGRPRRIVSLSAAHTETLYALGAAELLVGADTYSDYPPEVRPKATLNCWPRPPLEQILALKPDLVLVLTQDEEFLREMEPVRVPVLKLFPKTVEKAYANIELLGRVTGKEEEARRVVRSMRERSRSVTERLRGAKPLRVLYELDAVDPARPFVAGNGGFYGELMTMAGAENVFADVQGPSTQVSLEQIVARDPQVILLGDTGSPVNPQSPQAVAARPGWSAISAVRKHRVHGVESERITRPGPRLMEGLEEMARRLHPERFK